MKGWSEGGRKGGKEEGRKNEGRKEERKVGNRNFCAFFSNLVKVSGTYTVDLSIG